MRQTRKSFKELNLPFNTLKQRLIVYRRLLVRVNIVIKQHKKRNYLYGNCWIFLCNELEDICKNARTCSPETNPTNNMVVNFPEIAKHKPNDKEFGKTWWIPTYEGVLIRKSVVEATINEILSQISNTK